MIKTILTAVFMAFTAIGFSQGYSGVGIKAGLNYSQNGDLKSDVNGAVDDILSGASQKTGYHIGIYKKIDLPMVYLRPEIILTSTSSEYNIENTAAIFERSKIDLPIMVGYKLLGPLHVFAGPAFQYVLKDTFNDGLQDFELSDLDKNITLGMQLGVGFNLNKIGIDIRLERGLTPNELHLVNTKITDVNDRIDSRPRQLIFSLSYNLN